MIAALPVSTLLLATGFGLVVLGYFCVLIHHNIIKIVIGFSLVDSGLAIAIVALGYVQGGTAPILDPDVPEDPIFVDPINAALAVTAIVIGFAVTAISLAYVIRLYRLHGSLDVRDFLESRG